MSVHFVYEFYDADDELLYVGCTGAIGPRFTGHANGRHWWPEVARIEATAYPDLESGLAAESTLIRELDPRHNQYETSREEAVRRRGVETRHANREKRHAMGIQCSRATSCPTCVAARRAARKKTKTKVA